MPTEQIAPFPSWALKTPQGVESWSVVLFQEVAGWCPVTAQEWFVHTQEGPQWCFWQKTTLVFYPDWSRGIPALNFYLRVHTTFWALEEVKFIILYFPSGLEVIFFELQLNQLLAASILPALSSWIFSTILWLGGKMCSKIEQVRSPRVWFEFLKSFYLTRIAFPSEILPSSSIFIGI